MALKTEFIINQQEAENLGHTEMINGILAGIHYFAKKAKLPFRDINQRDEGMLGDKKFKIYTRDAFADEDMLIYDSYYTKHPNIDIYILCKIKGGKYNYLGYVDKSVVETTRVVNMVGEDSSDASESIRRIFAEQYKNLNDFIKIEEAEQVIAKEIKHQSWTPLHMHSEFSVGDGFGKISYITDALKAKGFKGAALTDHGTLAGVWEFQKQCLAKDLKPIIGCELYVKLNNDEKRYHTLVHVKNETGWKNLLKLNKMAAREHFYYKPVVPFESLLHYHEGLIITTGCSSAPIPKMIEAGKMEEAEALMDRIKSIFGDDFYAEIQIHTIEANQIVMHTLFDIAQKKNIKCILTTDSHYPYKEDKVYHDALKAVNNKVKFGEGGYGDDIFYLLEDGDFKLEIDKRQQCNWMMPHYQEFLNNTNEILDKCNFTIQPPNATDTLPKLEFPGQTRKEKLKELCIEGLGKYTKYKYEGAIKDRLDLEIDRITSKDYENYFLIVADMIKWSKENGIMCGPGRGSVGASLAAYCLNITGCDPIEHELLFDRFLSNIRRDMPDVDMDFADDRRDDVYRYLETKYGKDHTAKIATYSRFHPKGILRDMGRIFSVPSQEINKMCSMVLERSGGDARASFSLSDTFDEFPDAKKFKEKYPLLAEIAMKLEGHIRHKGVHAAAMVVTENDLSDYVPINKMGGEIVTEWEKQLVEDMKLVKFDILGLRTLSVIQDCINDIKQPLPDKFDDPKVYDTVFKTGATVGIFQFGATGLQKFATQVKIDDFGALYDTTTLFRPGALHSGQAMMYVNRKLGKEEVTYMQPSLKDITKSTKGIILYQEQIMQIMNHVGGMSWATAEMARKVITKSKGKDAFNKMRDEFVSNANRIHNISKVEAEKLYDVVSTFGSYSFNKAHAVEYSIISYWGAWLKTYYPQYFYKSLLKYESDDKEIKNIILDANKRGIQFEFPDVNKSEFSYSIIDGKVYAGLNSIIGIGLKTVDKIISKRPYTSLEDFNKRAKVSSKIYKGLVIADAFRDFNINKKEQFTEDVNCIDDFDEIELARHIYELTNLTPKIDIKTSFNFGDYQFTDIIELPNNPGGKQYLIRGIVTDVLNKDKLLRSDVNKHTHQFERHMIYLNVNDGTDNVACQINPETYEKYSALLEKIKKQPVVVLGTTTKDGRKMYADMIQVISDPNSNDIDKYFMTVKSLENDNAVITSARPAVSKNGKSYYRITLSDGADGLCFRFNEKLFPGMVVSYSISQRPFINIKVVTSDKNI